MCIHCLCFNAHICPFVSSEVATSEKAVKLQYCCHFSHGVSAYYFRKSRTIWCMMTHFHKYCYQNDSKAGERKQLDFINNMIDDIKSYKLCHDDKNVSQSNGSLVLVEKGNFDMGVDIKLWIKFEYIYCCIRGNYNMSSASHLFCLKQTSLGAEWCIYLRHREKGTICVEHWTVHPHHLFIIMFGMSQLVAWNWRFWPLLAQFVKIANHQNIINAISSFIIHLQYQLLQLNLFCFFIWSGLLEIKNAVFWASQTIAQAGSSDFCSLT